MFISKKKPFQELLQVLTSWWEILVIQGVSVAIVLFSPDDVLTQYPMLSEFVDVIAGWFPPVAAYQRASEFSQVTGLYFSVMFFLTPMILSYSFRTRGAVLKGIAIAYSRWPVRYCILVPFFYAFSLSMPFLLYFCADGRDEMFPSMPIKSSKLALACLGWFAAGGVAWMCVSCAMFVSIFFANKILKTKSKGPI